MNNENGDLFFWLSVIANCCQIESYSMNKSQISNDEILKHLAQQDQILDKQDKILDEQTNIYLKRIVEQNEEILRYLKERS